MGVTPRSTICVDDTRLYESNKYIFAWNIWKEFIFILDKWAILLTGVGKKIYNPF